MWDQLCVTDSSFYVCSLASSLFITVTSVKVIVSNSNYFSNIEFDDSEQVLCFKVIGLRHNITPVQIARVHPTGCSALPYPTPDQLELHPYGSASVHRSTQTQCIHLVDQLGVPQISSTSVTVTYLRPVIHFTRYYGTRLKFQFNRNAFSGRLSLHFSPIAL